MSLLMHEEVVVRRGSRSGIYVVVAIHSTVLGPSLGGLRLWRYEALGDAIADALRLSEAMTYKAAAAGLDLGGGKAVVCAPPNRELPRDTRRELMLDLGDIVDSPRGSLRDRGIRGHRHRRHGDHPRAHRSRRRPSH